MRADNPVIENNTIVVNFTANLCNYCTNIILKTLYPTGKTFSILPQLVHNFFYKKEYLLLSKSDTLLYTEYKRGVGYGTCPRMVTISNISTQRTN